ncbi:hypothetical protein, partial [Branchiibius sp. NY16-3462-2]|uniref:hypothetical protein n=1 Tax=Branchiibius sp. NY16-3462-2 TaxID=1807500 RepID=UPI0025BE0F0E
VADRSATSAVANIERELRRICVGMKPSEQGEHRLHEAEHTWKTTPADWTDEHMVYPGPSDGDELQVTTVQDDVEFRWMTGDVVQAMFTCAGATIPQVLAGMIWRTYCQPDETFSWLSRTPTIVYERLLELAGDER